jgi:hypothetical protein
METYIIVLIIIIIIIALYFIYWLYSRYVYKHTYEPLLIEDEFAATSKKVIVNSNIRTSKVGIQFTYSFWIYINDLTYMYNNWKSILVKQQDQSISPGIWIHPDINTIKIEMATINKSQEFIDIENIPLQKWVFIAVVLNDRYLHVFIDGELKTTKKMTYIPLLNGGNVSIGGFNGTITNCRYFNRSLDIAEIKKLYNTKREVKTLWWLY